MRRIMETAPRYFIPPEDYYFLLGPRGTGKTWLTQRRYPDALRIDLLDPEILRGLKLFGEDFPECKRWLLYRGKERLLLDGILCVPCEEFLVQLMPNSFPG